MDPTNNPTPTPTPNPTPRPASMPNANLGSSPSAASNPIPASRAPSEVMSGSSSGASPVASPVLSGSSAPGGGGSASKPVSPVAQPGGMPIQTPINPIVRPSGMGVTDPIMMPEKPREPDPIEQELKAPMKAAAPVPGSIGSAMNGPSALNVEAPAENPFANRGTNKTPSVAFTDPAAAASGVTSQPIGSSPKSAKKKTSKTTLIALIAVAAVVVIVLVIVLVMQLTGGGSTASNELDEEIAVVNTGDEAKDEVEIEDEVESEGDDVSEPVSGLEGTSLVICASEQANNEGAFNTQTITLTIEDGKMVSVDRETSVENEEGLATSKEVEETSLDNVIGGIGVLNTAEEQYMTDNDEVLASLDGLSARMESVLNAKGGAVYVCETA